MKGKAKKLFSRFSIMGLTIILLFLILTALFIGLFYLAQALIVYYFPQASRAVAITLVVLDWLVVTVAIFHCANRDRVPETRFPWIITIACLNVLGVAIYVVFSTKNPSKKKTKLYRSVKDCALPFENPPFSKEDKETMLGSWHTSSDSLTAVNPPSVLYANTKTEYFPTGEQYMRRLIKDLEDAKKFIFLEYFIIAKGKLWSAILSILEKKVKEGVEVRVIYDDIGSIGRVHVRYHKTLQKKGIQCVKFNPFVPIVSNAHNNRDHRKIAVIDGVVGYTGGINLADEYVNLTSPYGHWKDTGIRLEGEGVRSLTTTFLKLYNVSKKRTEDFSPYIPSEYPKFENEGFVQPYGDGPRPLYGAHLGEDVYINLLNSAQKYAYIMTPYLIIDYNMRGALLLAARRGVDVRIITPHIPDKKIPFALTRSNYLALIKGGVKIYEYTPGFVHGKSMLVDGEAGVVGTINLDYRSFLHHYENAVLMFKTQALPQLLQDFEQSFAVSALQTEEDAKKSVIWRWACEFAKIFAPLL